MVILIGLPGSGKSTWAAGRKGVVSSDEIRRLLVDDPGDQSVQRVIFAVLRAIVRRRLELARPVTYVDATNLTPRERRPYIQLARMYGAASEAVFFNTPLAVCSERNRARARVVPDEVMLRFAAKLIPPRTEEGFARIDVID